MFPARVLSQTGVDHTNHEAATALIEVNRGTLNIPC